MNNLNIRNRYIGPCEVEESDSSAPSFDLTGFVIKLLLFDKFILESIRLNEFPFLVANLGYDGLHEILSSGAININDEAITVGQIGQSDLMLRSKRKNGTLKTILPVNSYAFAIITAHDNLSEIHRDLKKIDSLTQLKLKDREKLKKLIVSKLVWFPEVSVDNILSQLMTDFRNKIPVIRESVLSVLRKQVGSNDDLEKKIQLNVEVDDDDDTHVTSNLASIYKLDTNTIHQIIEKGLLAVGSLNHQIEKMRAFSSLTGFRESELPLFENKLSFLANTIDPELYEQRAKNILSWPIFPDLSDALLSRKLSIKKLLSVRESKECIEFRNWLWSSNPIADNELHKRVESLLSKLSLVYSSDTGKNIRWFASNALGLVIPPAGIALSALDHFMIQKILNEDGLITFLGKTYPSIFKQK